MRRGGGAGCVRAGNTPGVRIETRAADETEAAGAELAQRLRLGDVVLVMGELGSGKTTFVRGACRRLGVREPVTSPTFTIGQVYQGQLRGSVLEVAHLDLYRLPDLSREDPGLIADYLRPERVAFIEWPEAAEPELEAVAARVTIAHGGGDRRTIDLG